MPIELPPEDFDRLVKESFHMRKWNWAMVIGEFLTLAVQVVVWLTVLLGVPFIVILILSKP